MSENYGWREFWHRLQHQLQVGLSWMISSLVETSYLALWVLLQWSFERLLALLPVPHNSRWELEALRAIFALSTFIMIMFAIYADLRRAWYEAQNLITETQGSPDTERTQPSKDKLRPLPLDRTRLRRTLTQVFCLVLLVGIVVAGAGLVGAITKTIWGIASYLVTLTIASYLYLSASRLNVPAECVALTKLGHDVRLLWGPLTYYTWPIVENLTVTIPLYTLCLDSEQYQVTIVDGTLVVRIRVCYEISRNGNLSLNVLNAARTTSDSRKHTGRRLLSFHRTSPVKASKGGVQPQIVCRPAR